MIFFCRRIFVPRQRNKVYQTCPPKGCSAHPECRIAVWAIIHCAQEQCL